ncbi:MAG: DUF4326 domain-containing protein [Candidatus Colwellbacteria bacterium]|nr:DUF4326 domain-containing protein [Candidatus Colwellbacteria bacterium]
MSRPLPTFLKKIIAKKEVIVEKKKKIVEIVFESESESEEELPDESEIVLESGDSDSDENPSGCTVVKIARKGGKIDVDCDVYIGRRCTMGGWNLKESKWHNPFKVDEKNTIDKVLDDFLFYMKSGGRFGGRNLMEDLPELKGKVLGCWCKKKGNEQCHGDVLVNLLNEQIRDERKKIREMKRKIEDDKKNKEMSDNAMALLEKLLDENKRKMKEKDTERKVNEEKNKAAVSKQWARRREVIETYGENHDIASQCEDTDRPLTPIRDSPDSPISPLDIIDESKDDEKGLNLHTIEECREYDERDHCIMSQETQSLPTEIPDFFDEME